MLQRHGKRWIPESNTRPQCFIQSLLVIATLLVEDCDLLLAFVAVSESLVLEECE
jgi:hypothetical protein